MVSLTMENILESCVVELENMEGIIKLRRDISSKRLFCKGVPVSSKRRSACMDKKKGHMNQCMWEKSWGVICRKYMSEFQ